MCIAIETAECEMGECGGPLDEEECGLGSFFVVEDAKGCKRCGASFLYSEPRQYLVQPSIRFVAWIYLQQIDKG